MPRTQHYRSKALTRSQVLKAIAAHDYAKASGNPLNLTMDIHWHWTRFVCEGIWNRRKALVKLLEIQRHWLAYHGHGFYCIAVREAPPGSVVGEHTHLLIHVPQDLQAAFVKHTRAYLRGKKRHQKQALNSETVYSDGKLAYILKGATQKARNEIAAWFRTDHERSRFAEATRGSVNQGTIYGKRLFISQALGPSARLGKRAFRAPKPRLHVLPMAS